ncbi:galactokinase family protein [Pseudoflavonifractor intestinihominis]|uniref:Galactokinase family protein n=1 Tax=Pseudoflavonifractor intestinihominis TaxID=3133171 RepID=A0ABV1ED98_9FIRM|nr:galactokinase family protein [uncultured Pseudoflavonifractor sp.]
MLSCKTLIHQLSAGDWDERLNRLYCCDGGEALEAVRARAIEAVKRYQALFSAGDEVQVALFSSPGRTELGGNHTDHQHGCVLAASVNMDMLAVAAPNGTAQVRIHSEGYQVLTVDLSDLSPAEGEKETSASLVRGVAARMAQLGQSPAGFDAYVCSSVPAGSGLSSSAAYEVLVGTIFNVLFCNQVFTPVQVAQIGQFAENVFFGKPCGLMDETASAVGGVVSIDFKDPSAPVVRKVDFDFPATGHTLCIINSGADHADLTDAYAAITNEMKSVAACFGKEVLRDVDETTFRATIPDLRKALGDRAVLRAIHFFAENRRAIQEAQALEKGDFAAFLALVRASGLSSSLYLQNTFAPSDPRQQAIPMVLWAAEEVLQGTGAVRVHGGGFAGTVQAFVPNDKLPDFLSAMERLLGKDMCHMLSIRPEGGCLVAG